MSMTDDLLETLRFRKQTEVLDPDHEQRLDEAIESLEAGECVYCDRPMHTHRTDTRYIPCPEWPDDYNPFDTHD